ncbi:HNH endonuclease [Mycobacterium sp. PSTR-4-N]|uniref:HNH endonuclease signature motif containing protein n=1 Tax=Mycobacterium sp. PSTR-4-N TaxID=2917745 RepID=UPI001F14C995|nr:HNH endonuclease [Mycobacterium sp. PSTR-4-N]MCG7593725.1 HNH endonuclease [Mycobacterium sp. PSTR-4-N]
MATGGISRYIPVDVRRQLRREVGFGCPVPVSGGRNCGNPYLTYHHFDPEWHVEQHNDPDRMIALCSDHHNKARAFSVSNCREMKETAKERAGEVAGRFDWMKHNVLMIAGGNAYYDNTYDLVWQDNPLLWFTRDDDDRRLLNIRMPPQGDEPRTSLIDNDWILEGEPVDVISPPNGSELNIRYSNGDNLYIKFRTVDAADTLIARWPWIYRYVNRFEFPVTTVEVNLQVEGILELTPDAMTQVGFAMNISASAFIRNGVGLRITHC